MLLAQLRSQTWVRSLMPLCWLIVMTVILSVKYDVMKSAILCAYELVLEVYLGAAIFNSILPLGNIRKQGISFHCYADNTQLHILS